MSDLYMNEWKAFLSELEAAPKKAVASLDKFRKDMLGGGAKSSAPFTKDGFPKDFNKPEEFSAPAMEEADVEEDKLFKPLSKSQKAHSSKLIRVKYKDRPLDADGVIDPKVAKGEKESLYEKKDRCYNIAKRKYKAFPSAYASGAIVKCRQGKIWKKEK